MTVWFLIGFLLTGAAPHEQGLATMDQIIMGLPYPFATEEECLKSREGEAWRFHPKYVTEHRAIATMCVAGVVAAPTERPH